ncbi:DeoR/GlpR family DNA-binding transcription regulator [Catenulispora rubra]|uniref:DeoR/GlpR family DNA-binding transcription regulator n=1 Tax=Catenulispora rubra TaxID=280293 RepID=UPI0018927A0A|nr:DeoR/GlpR family DNA-binding transcription regulator [Catenulispora rubra]
MLAAQRQAWILQEVRQRGAVRVTELVSALRVSDMTVRRDLDSLAEQGLVTKVHGGATARGGSSTDEPAFSVKAARQRRAKEAIARAAADLVRPGTAIGVSAGSTTYAFAQQLARVPDLTVVTNSPPVADLLHALPGPPQTVILTGGVRTISDALVGPVAIQAIRRLHLDCVFIGVHGIDAEAGFTSPNLMEAETNRMLVSTARRLVVLADHTKWGVVGLSEIAALHDASVLVSDDGLRSGARQVLRESVGELIVVPVEGAVPDEEED